MRTTWIVLFAVAVAGVALFKFSARSSTPQQISYLGRSYTGGAEVKRTEVTTHFGSLRHGRGSIDGKQVFVTAGTPPHAIALRLPDGHFDAYELMKVTMP